MASLNGNIILEQLPLAAANDVDARCCILEQLAEFVSTEAVKFCNRFYPTLVSAHDAGDITSISISKLLPPDGQGGLYKLRNPLALKLFVSRVVRSEAMNMVRFKVQESQRATSIHRPTTPDGDQTIEDVTADENATIPGTPSDHTTDEDREVGVTELPELLRGCMCGLSVQEREAIMIRFQFAGAPPAPTFGKQQLVTVKQVAELMGVPQHDVNNWIHRGLKKLAAELEALGCQPLYTETGLHILQEVHYET